jgi:hypothetical protein
MDIKNHAAKYFLDGPFVRCEGKGGAEKLVVVAITQVPVFAEDPGQGVDLGAGSGFCL